MGTPDIGLDLDPEAATFYRQVLQQLQDDALPFLLGGAFAFAHHTGIRRETKDLDLFVRAADYPRIAARLQASGHHTELTYPHWLGKVHRGPLFVDLIFNSGNGLTQVDDAWFAYAGHAWLLGVPVRVVPAEEMVWSKAFVMERERYDGADVAHLVRACAHDLDWARLLQRFGAQWRVLLSHLMLFGFVYPGDRGCVPPWVITRLLERVRAELQAAPPGGRVCQGTLLSREQYLHDVERLGYRDVRTTSVSSMTPDDVLRWTEAISLRDEARPGDG
jgi:Nucleotidyl transferase of unknown function (DUF2204)